EAHALLAAVVDGEVDALPADHRGVPAGLLAAGRLDLDDLGPEIGEDHAPARARLEARQFENAHTVEREAHRDARTWTPARSSCKSQGDVESRSPQPRAMHSMSCCSPAVARGMGTSCSRASAVARPRSLRASLSAKRTASKSPLKTTSGIMWDRIRPCPKEAPRMASSSASGFTPAFTPSVKPSATSERVTMLIMLCTSLAIVPAPMGPM